MEYLYAYPPQYNSLGQAVHPYVYWGVAFEEGNDSFVVVAFKENGFQFYNPGTWTVELWFDGGAHHTVPLNSPANQTQNTTTVGYISMSPLPNAKTNINMKVTSSWEESGVLAQQVIGVYNPPYVAQASRISCSSSASLGDELPIYITADDTTYTHTLSYSFDKLTWNEFSVGTKATEAGTPYSVILDTSELSTYFTTQTQRSVSIMCSTFSGANQIGNSAVVNCTITDSGAAPTVSIGCTPSNDNDIVRGWGIYLQTYSKIHVIVSYELHGGSQFRSCSITVDGVEISNSSGGEATREALSDVMSSSGYKEVKATVLDSRGMSSTATYQVYVYPYAKPYASSRSALRYSSNVNTEDKAGTNLSAKATMGYSSIGGRNSAGISVRYKESGSTTWSSPITLTSGNANHVKINGSATVSTEKSYVVQFIIYDTLHPQNADPTPVEVTIVTNTVIFHAKDGGGGFAVGDYCKNDNAFEVNYRLVLNSMSYGSTLPPASEAVEGQVFFRIN